MAEIWAKIKNYPSYEISNLGKIKRIIPDYRNRIGILNPITSKGYKRIMLYPDRKMFFIHKLVMEAFNGTIPGDKQVNHKNGKKNDNRLSNLEYCTAKENTVHAHKTGLVDNKGSKNNLAKLKESDVKKIRKEYGKKGVTYKSLAKKYKVVPSNIRFIVKKLTWKHIK